MIYGNTVLTDAMAWHPKPATKVREPLPADGPAVWKLIDSTPSLDGNSLYCNLLQCSHFASTCALAERKGAIAGWLSGYVPPGRTDTLFIWQVCVVEEARGEGLAKRMIGAVLARPGADSIRRIDCTITEDNSASWALFGAVARSLNAQMQQSEHFSKGVHFEGNHASELAVSIGPFDRARIAALTA